MEKEIRIFDTHNRVLMVKGIRFELYEVGSAPCSIRRTPTTSIREAVARMTGA